MSWLDLIGWCGSALLIVSVMQARLLRFRVLNLSACIVLTGFNAALAIWPMVAMNVALVLLHDDGDGVARVLLDYVTPKFRDFSPGEFVWRRSDTLRGHGFTRVVTPANMVDAYYERLGFVRDQQSGSWLLDL